MSISEVWGILQRTGIGAGIVKHAANKGLYLMNAVKYYQTVYRFKKLHLNSRNCGGILLLEETIGKLLK